MTWTQQINWIRRAQKDRRRSKPVSCATALALLRVMRYPAELGASCPVQKAQPPPQFPAPAVCLHSIISTSSSPRTKEAGKACTAYLLWEPTRSGCCAGKFSAASFQPAPANVPWGKGSPPQESKEEPWHQPPLQLLHGHTLLRWWRLGPALLLVPCCHALSPWQHPGSQSCSPQCPWAEQSPPKLSSATTQLSVLSFVISVELRTFNEIDAITTSSFTRSSSATKNYY